jgi:iron complex transport system ATP-binding protein
VTFEVRNGSFAYPTGRKVLNDVSFSIGENRVVSVLGPNGAGKTTLLRCMLGLLRWTSGGSYIDGKLISEQSHREVWRKIGYVPQAKLSTFAYTVSEMVLLGRSAHLKMLEKPGSEDKKIADRCLNMIGVSHLHDKLCSKISGGELQMVLIARALAAEPKLLVLDEPESNLDFRNQLIVMNAIRALRDEYGISSILNTHYPEHALSVSDGVIVLHRDGSAQFGSAKDIVTEPGLRKLFGVDVRIRCFDCNKCSYTAVMPIALA